MTSYESPRQGSKRGQVIGNLGSNVGVPTKHNNLTIITRPTESPVSPDSVQAYFFVIRWREPPKLYYIFTFCYESLEVLIGIYLPNFKTKKRFSGLKFFIGRISQYQRRNQSQ